MNLDYIAVHHAERVCCVLVVHADTVEGEAKTIRGDVVNVVVSLDEFAQRSTPMDGEVGLTIVLNDLDSNWLGHGVMVCMVGGVDAFFASVPLCRNCCVARVGT